MEKNIIHFKSSTNMSEIESNSIDLIVTSPPYFDIKDYSGILTFKRNDVGAKQSFEKYLDILLKIWKEAERVLRPNGKLVINVPIIPILKRKMNTHHNRDVYDLQSNIQNQILSSTNLFLMDIAIWNRTNSSKKIMFGSYPHPPNFYLQNTIEFISIYVKDGKPKKVSKDIKEKSKLTQSEWVNFTKQIWDIPSPNKKDIAYGKHPAIMPEELVRRVIRLYSFYDDVILDPMCGSGTTLKVAKELGRNYIGYELYPKYKKVIDEKLS